jgi:hypothetical protein
MQSVGELLPPAAASITPDVYSVLEEDFTPLPSDQESGLSSETYARITETIFARDGTQDIRGNPSTLTTGAFIVVGFSLGSVYVFDYAENLKTILGCPIAPCAITSICIPASNDTIIGGYINGTIVIWNLLSGEVIKNIAPAARQATKPNGHLEGASIIHLNHVQGKKNDFVSADNQGMVFYHSISRIGLVNIVRTTRMLGRYDEPNGALPRKPTTVFGLSSLQLSRHHCAKELGLVAIITPYKMMIAATRPQHKTLFRAMRPKSLDAEYGNFGTCGNLVWCPPTLLNGI